MPEELLKKKAKLSEKSAKTKNICLFWQSFFFLIPLIIWWPLGIILGPFGATWPPGWEHWFRRQVKSLWCLQVKHLTHSPLSEVEAYDLTGFSESELKSGQSSDTALPQGHNSAKLELRLLLSRLVLTVLWLAERTSLEEVDREGEW